MIMLFMATFSVIALKSDGYVLKNISKDTLMKYINGVLKKARY